MSEYTFRLARQDELPKIVLFYHSLIGTPGCTWHVDYPTAAIAATDFAKDSLYVLEHDNQIVAVATVGDLGQLSDIEWTPKHPCELARLGVMKSAQHTGIGTIVMQHVLDVAKARGFDGIKLLTSPDNIAARSLYRKFGFKKCGEFQGYNHYWYGYELVF